MKPAKRLRHKPASHPARLFIPFPFGGFIPLPFGLPKRSIKPFPAINILTDYGKIKQITT